MESLDQEFASKPEQVNGLKGRAEVIEPPLLIPFADAPHQKLTLPVIEAMMRDLFANHKRVWVKLIAHAYGVDDTDLMPEPGPKRGRGAAQ